MVQTCDTIIKYYLLLLTYLLSRVTVAQCFVYEVIRDLESTDHLSINPIRRIGLIHKRYLYSC